MLTQTANTTWRVKMPQCQIRSTFDRNFIAAAISRKPITTCSEFIQPPDFGNRDNTCGTKARTKNGTANTVENASMPARGQRQFPCDVMTSKVPTKGAVQVNEVSVNVKPISNAPSTLLPSLLRVMRSSRLRK